MTTEHEEEKLRRTSSSDKKLSSSNDDGPPPPPSAKRQRLDKDARKQQEDTSNKDVIQGEGCTAQSDSGSQKAAEPQTPSDKVPIPKNSVPTTNHPSLTTPTLYVGNLHPRLTSAHLEKMFSKYGRIVRLDLKNNGSTNQKNYAFCQFQSVAEAQQALDNLNGRSLLQRNLVIRAAHQQHGAPRAANPTLQTLDQRAANNNDKPQSQASIRFQQRKLDDKIQELKRKLGQGN